MRMILKSCYKYLIGWLFLLGCIKFDLDWILNIFDFDLNFEMMFFGIDWEILRNILVIL